MIQELELTHRHHMARPSPGIPLQIKICLHSFVFFCDDIGSLTFNRGRNTTSDEVQTQTQWQPRKNIGCTRVCCDSVLCCIFHSFAPPPLMCGVYCVCGAQVCSTGQAVPGARAGSGQSWWRGRAQSWRRHGSGDTDSDKGKVDRVERRHGD